MIRPSVRPPRRSRRLERRGAAGSAGPGLLDLPDDLLRAILGALDDNDRVSTRLVNRRFAALGLPVVRYERYDAARDLAACERLLRGRLCDHTARLTATATAADALTLLRAAAEGPRRRSLARVSLRLTDADPGGTARLARCLARHPLHPVSTLHLRLPERVEPTDPASSACHDLSALRHLPRLRALTVGLDNRLGRVRLGPMASLERLELTCHEVEAPWAALASLRTLTLHEGCVRASDNAPFVAPPRLAEVHFRYLVAHAAHRAWSLARHDGGWTLRCTYVPVLAVYGFCPSAICTALLPAITEATMPVHAASAYGMEMLFVQASGQVPNLAALTLTKHRQESCCIDGDLLVDLCSRGVRVRCEYVD